MFPCSHRERRLSRPPRSSGSVFHRSVVMEPHILSGCSGRSRSGISPVSMVAAQVEVVQVGERPQIDAGIDPVNWFCGSTASVRLVRPLSSSGSARQRVRAKISHVRLDMAAQLSPVCSPSACWPPSFKAISRLSVIPLRPESAQLNHCPRATSSFHVCQAVQRRRYRARNGCCQLHLLLFAGTAPPGLVRLTVAKVRDRPSIDCHEVQDSQVGKVTQLAGIGPVRSLVRRFR